MSGKGQGKAGLAPGSGRQLMVLLRLENLMASLY